MLDDKVSASEPELWMSVCVCVACTWLLICLDFNLLGSYTENFIYIHRFFFSASFSLVCHSRRPKRRCLRFHYALTQNKRQTVVKISHIPDLFDKSIDIECVWHWITWRDTVDWTSKRMRERKRLEWKKIQYTWNLDRKIFIRFRCVSFSCQCVLSLRARTALFNFFIHGLQSLSLLTAFWRLLLNFVIPYLHNNLNSDHVDRLLLLWFFHERSHHDKESIRLSITIFHP